MQKTGLHVSDSVFTQICMTRTCSPCACAHVLSHTKAPVPAGKCALSHFTPGAPTLGFASPLLAVALPFTLAAVPRDTLLCTQTRSFSHGHTHSLPCTLPLSLLSQPQTLFILKLPPPPPSAGSGLELPWWKELPRKKCYHSFWKINMCSFFFFFFFSRDPLKGRGWDHLTVQTMCRGEVVQSSFTLQSLWWRIRTIAH